MNRDPLKPFLTSIPTWLTVGFAFLYWSTATFDFSYDSLTYALSIEFGVPKMIFHPYHLFSCVPAYLLHRFFLLMGHPLRALFINQFLNHILGGLTLGFFYQALQKKYGRFRALLGTLLLGFSSAFWYEATDAGSYAMACLLTCVILGWVIGSFSFPPFLLGCLHGLAVTVHEMLILVAPSVFFLLLGKSPRNDFEKKSKFTSSGRYLLGLILVAGISYLSVLLALGHSFHEALFWLFGPPAPPANSGFFKYYWSLDFWDNISSLGKGFAYGWLAPMPYKYIRILWWLVLGGLLAWVPFRILRIYRHPTSQNERIAALVLWILMMNLFQFFYSPGLVRFRLLFYPACLALLFELAGDKQKMKWNYGLSTLLLLLGSMNFHTLILPKSRPEGSANLVQSLWIGQHLQAQDYFLFAGIGKNSIVNVYVAYFAFQVPARSLKGFYYGAPRGDLAYFDKIFEDKWKKGGKVFFENSLFDRGIQRELEKEGGCPPGSITKWVSGFRREKEIRLPTGYGLVQIAPG